MAAQEVGPQDIVPPQVRPRRKGVIGSVTARYSVIQVANDEGNVRTFSSNAAVELWTSNDGIICAQLVKTCTSAINDTNRSEIERCAMYASAMIAILPGMKRIFTDFFRRNGYSVVDFDDDARAEGNIALHEWVDVPVIALHFGQLVNVLYKNISDVSYAMFMSKRTKAIAARAGVSEKSDEYQIVLTLDSAALIRRKIGADDAVRKAILEAVMKNERVPGPVGNVCNYLMEILAWTEMSGVIFILNTLLKTKSPILRDNRVASEMIALAEAYGAIMKSDYPQFYKILNPTEANKLLIRNKYATMVAVAQTCYADQSSQVRNYQSTTSNTNPVVAELVEIHRNYMNNQAQALNQGIIDFLTSNEGVMEDIIGIES